MNDARDPRGSRDTRETHIANDAPEAPSARSLAAFLIVMACAVCVPLLGVAAFAALVPALAACIAALRSGAKYLYFVPGTVAAVALCFALDITPAFYCTMLGAAIVCGTALGIAAKLRASATAQTLTASIALLIVAAGAVAVVSHYVFGSVEQAVRAAYNYAVDALTSFGAALDRAVASYSAKDPQAASALELYSLSGLDASEVVRSLMLSLPGLLAAAAFVFGWAWQLLSRVFLTIFGRRDMITAERRVAIPATVAVIFLVLRLVTFFASGDSLFFACASNVVVALYPVMLVVGGGFLIDVARSGRSRFSIMFVIMFAISAVIMPSVFVSALSVAGVIGTIVRAMREKREKNE